MRDKQLAIATRLREALFPTHDEQPVSRDTFDVEATSVVIPAPVCTGLGYTITGEQILAFYQVVIEDAQRELAARGVPADKFVVYNASNEEMTTAAQAFADAVDLRDPDQQISVTHWTVDDGSPVIHKAVEPHFTANKRSPKEVCKHYVCQGTRVEFEAVQDGINALGGNAYISC